MKNVTTDRLSRFMQALFKSSLINKVIVKLHGLTPVGSSKVLLNWRPAGYSGSTACVVCRTGFTLIELLVVVLIIGILAAIALPQYRVAVRKSRLAEMMTMTKAIKNAQEVYYMANGTYTRNFYDLDVTPPAGATVTANGDLHLPSGMTLLVQDSSEKIGQRVYALNLKEKLGFAEYMDFSLSRAGKKVCTAYGEDPVSVRVCKSISGKTDGRVDCGGGGGPNCLIFLF